MKLTHIAQVLTLALLVVTAYLALQARDESVRSREADDKRAVQMNQQLQAIAAQNAASVTLPPPTPALPSPAPVIAPAHIASKPAGSAPASPLALESPRPSSPPPPPAPEPKPLSAEAGSSSAPPLPSIADLPLTPLQRRVKSSPSLGKVKEYQPDQGFVVLSAGSRQGLKEGVKLDLRRDASIVGRIKITSVEESESVADVEFKSVPEGVTLQPGDEIIGVVLAQ